MNDAPREPSKKNKTLRFHRGVFVSGANRTFVRNRALLRALERRRGGVTNGAPRSGARAPARTAEKSPRRSRDLTGGPFASALEKAPGVSSSSSPEAFAASRKKPRAACGKALSCLRRAPPRARAPRPRGSGASPRPPRSPRLPLRVLSVVVRDADDGCGARGTSNAGAREPTNGVSIRARGGWPRRARSEPGASSSSVRGPTNRFASWLSCASRVAPEPAPAAEA